MISGVSSVIEAEDFDDGGQDISFSFKTVRQEIIRITVQRKEWLSVKAEKL